MKHTQTPLDNYNEWETAIAEVISEKLGCDYGDASGIIEANPFIMAQSWAAGSPADLVAQNIINAP